MSSERRRGGDPCGRGPIEHTEVAVGKGPVDPAWDGADPRLCGQPAAEDAGFLEGENAAGGEPITGVSLLEQARALLPKLTEARRYALHLAAGMGHVEWNFYPASFKWLAANGLVVRDEEGYARCEPLGRVAAKLIAEENHG
jgi:hypothetical protein